MAWIHPGSLIPVLNQLFLGISSPSYDSTISPCAEGVSQRLFDSPASASQTLSSFGESRPFAIIPVVYPTSRRHRICAPESSVEVDFLTDQNMIQFKEEKHQWDRSLEQEGAGRMLYSLLHFAGCCSLWVHPPLPFHQIPSPSGQWQPRAEPHSLINLTFRSEMRAIISLHLLCTALCEVKSPHYFHMQSTQ